MVPIKNVIAVMSAYNTSRTLGATLDEIPTGSFDEIVLVDDAGKDDTVAEGEGMDFDGGGAPTESRVGRL